MMNYGDDHGNHSAIGVSSVAIHHTYILNVHYSTVFYDDEYQ